MESYLRLLLLLITLAIVHAQDQDGFISLDCGLAEDELSPYYESFTRLKFSSDATVIQGGKTGRIQSSPVNDNLMKPYTTLRYFPDGIRNCYDLKVEKGRRYLIRASFVYGNYDGRDIKPVFDLYFGPNIWATIDLEAQVNGTREDIIHTVTSNSLQICLVKTGETTPLISALEIRPMENDYYSTESVGSLKLHSSKYLSESGARIRYTYDVYDRIWSPYFLKEHWTLISSIIDMSNINKNDPPEDALINAATPTNASAPLTITWSSENPDDHFYLYAHFCEIQDLQKNETREFSLVWNGEDFHGPIIPRQLITLQDFRTCEGGECTVQLIRTNRSTHPPLLNAFEIYTFTQFPQSKTIESDVAAIKSIEASYGLSKINWQGDPCFPRQFRWDGITCSNTNMSIPPRITTLNLSSSGMSATIAAAIQNLTKLEKLDLSNNNLTGGVPEFLGNMKSLSVINLSGNNLDGSIPQALQREGLELIVEKGNPKLCLSGSCIEPVKKKAFVPIVASIACAAIVIALVVIFLVLKKKNLTILQGLHLLRRMSARNVIFTNKKSRRFTYSQVIEMTDNFQRVLGKGGFGMVYHGTVNDSEQVAVKVLSQSSTQGYKEFKAEVDLLMRVHHTNLVSLVGYCDEGDHLALIYEFMSNGDLKQHLSGNGDTFVINWSIRLQVALEAALGLEYLHIGCTPPMVHRDVKTANILLDENIKAKLADFGLSRSFQCGGESYDTTAVAGTPGYLDPEYYRTGRLAEKSDVYSFGIVLLEIITNQPVINQTSEYSHITQWVGFKINRGDIIEIMDPNLGMDFDNNSAWRALELAMSCADPSSSKRPSMSQVINELKECIVCENSRMSNKNQDLEEVNMSWESSVVPMAR